jgi:hypothetical protein
MQPSLGHNATSVNSTATAPLNASLLHEEEGQAMPTEVSSRRTCASCCSCFRRHEHWLQALESRMRRCEIWAENTECLIPFRYRLLQASRRIRAAIRNTGYTNDKTFECWRGMRDLVLTASFLEHGGTEIAPLSSTSSLSVATSYLLMQSEALPSVQTTGDEHISTASGKGLLFRICVTNPLQYGADLRFLSFFASEAEFLYPPLTFLKPSGRVTQIDFCGVKYTVVDVEPHFPS